MSKAKIIAGILALMTALGLTGYTIIKKSDVKSPLPKELYSVVKVIDGDTIIVEGDTHIRLIGVDAPEEGKCFAASSTAYLSSLLNGKKVRIEKDISGEDEYGRLLRYVVLPSGDERKDDVIVNEKLIRDGYAKRRQSPPDNRYRDLFATAEDEAKNANRGIWNACPEATTTNAEREVDTAPPSPDCIIKGNISEKGYGKTYLLPGCDNYTNVKIDTRKGEMYFCTETEAENAGFRKADNCPR